MIKDGVQVQELRIRRFLIKISVSAIAEIRVVLVNRSCDSIHVRVRKSLKFSVLSCLSTDMLTVPLHGRNRIWNKYTCLSCASPGPSFHYTLEFETIQYYCKGVFPWFSFSSGMIMYQPKWWAIQTYPRICLDGHTNSPNVSPRYVWTGHTTVQMYPRIWLDWEMILGKSFGVDLWIYKKCIWKMSSL